MLAAGLIFCLSVLVVSLTASLDRVLSYCCMMSCAHFCPFGSRAGCTFLAVTLLGLA